MLDKIEVGSKWKCKDRPSVIATVNAVGECRLLFSRSDYPTIEYVHDIARFTEDYEPSPESPVVQDDVIWEGKHYRFRLKGDYYEFKDVTRGGDWQPSFICNMAADIAMLMKSRAELYARLNPPTTTVEEWPKIGEEYFLADPVNRDCWVQWLSWSNCEEERRWKERGLIFKTEEEAIAKAKNMVEGVGK